MGPPTSQILKTNKSKTDHFSISLHTLQQFYHICFKNKNLSSSLIKKKKNTING